MLRRDFFFGAFIAVIILGHQGTFGQGSGAAYTGGYGYAPATPPASHTSNELGWETATRVITFTGTAELKIKPEKIRMVFAILSEGETGKECSDKIAKIEQSVIQSLVDNDIKKDDIVRDFIAVLPTYIWKPVEIEGERMVRQQRSGFRMQNNMHVLCNDEAQAMEVIELAFQQGVSDVVAFDYWSSKSDGAKKEARKMALEAAKEKAELLLSVFDEQPPIINIKETTTLHKPANLYRTFTRNLTESITLPRGWRDRPQIFAYRPQMTYLENLEESQSSLQMAIYFRCNMLLKLSTGVQQL